eukprot:4077458-Amphidinium_carterae.4
MPIKRKLLDKGFPQQRKLARARLGRLESLRVQPRTLRLYRKAVAIFFQWLSSAAVVVGASFHDLDLQLCEYVEFLRLSGGNRSEVGFVLSAVQFFLKRKHITPAAWNLWSTWQKHEMPWQAPPLPVQAWGAWVVLAAHGAFSFCCSSIAWFR